MVGCSGGSIATDWAAELASASAPELDLVGAAMGGVPVDDAHNLADINGSPDWSGVIPAILLGVARAFGVPLAPYLSSSGAQVIAQVHDGCIKSVVGHSPGLSIQSLLDPRHADLLGVPVFASIVNELIMGTDGTPRRPILLADGDSDGTGDGVMVAADVEALAHRCCAAGLPVTFLDERGLDHPEAAVPFELAAFPTIEGWLAGLPSVNGCGAVGTGALTLAGFAPGRDPVGLTDFPSTGQSFSVALASGSQASASTRWPAAWAWHCTSASGSTAAEHGARQPAGPPVALSARARAR
jgi:hypothetical protein